MRTRRPVFTLWLVMFSYCLLPVCEVAVVCLMINDSTESVNKHIFESVDVVMELKQMLKGIPHLVDQR